MASAESGVARPPYYENWLAELFGQPVSGNFWGFDFTKAGIPTRTGSEIVELIAATLLNCGEDLAQCDDWQIADGLKQIFNPASANLEKHLKRTDVPFEQRAAAILAIRSLFSDCFAVRCPPVLGHLSEVSESPLSVVCYMFWDASNLGYWEGKPDRDAAYDVVLQVMEASLASPNDACVESGLHGLGHLHIYCPEQVETIVEAFLAGSSGRRPELVAYARKARRGQVI